jgi:DNA-directed RNA polymerase subunit N (RpoN/RPB10)
MASSKEIQFVPIVGIICSCGRETGLYQVEIEFRLQDTIPGFKADSKDVSKVLDDLEIKRLCCRRTLLAVPVYQVVSADIGVVRYRREKGDIIEDRDELIIHPLLI